VIGLAGSAGTTGDKVWIQNCTFENNSAPNAQPGALFRFSVANSRTSPTLVNNIFSNNYGLGNQNLFSYNGTVNKGVVKNNLFRLNSSLPLDVSGNPIIGANGNIGGNPIYADAANGDYRLLAGSPGLDAGLTLANVTDDYFGATRPVGAGYDIGAIEGVGTAPPPPPNAIRDWPLF